MTVNTSKVTGRRGLRFNSPAEAVADAEMIVSNPCKTLGNWSIGEIIDHLARTIRISFDGPKMPVPWFVRTFVAPFMKRGFLTGMMPSGFQFTPQMEPLRPDPNADAQAAVRELKTQFARLEKEAPSAPHPFFGKLTHEEWIALMLRHCELHLSFVTPEAS